ncbi:unnamed protein product [Arabidopsis lyrata]|uniref:Uncharacterized protein n=1 Tax=Arabidopsis lyrata subsp. lyrata TaxID=81972 RepID=D7KQ21_ARALL|nr:hypothetical protein ARALYDRAFT_892754 [Arabidopsis lyrata subsp. lyrata]CAH8256750.1 unnamed protein product [Arabidopsis lyrata]
MAITRNSFAICLLLSLATIATADYYAPSSPPSYTSPVNKPTLPPPVYIPPVQKPTLPSPVYTPPAHRPTLSPPVYTKPTLPPPAYTPPVYTKPTLPAPVYTPPVYKPTLSPPVYTKPTLSPPVYKPTLSPPVYTKPTLSPPVYKPTLSPPVYTKPTLHPPVYKKSPSFSPPPPYVPKPTYTPPTKPYVPEIIKAVDGIILCKNGAKAKIVCSEMISYGKNKNEVVIYSNPTDSKGYFHVALTHIKNLSHCRVKLYTSPVETCKNPTNVNKGLTGVLLSMYSADKNLKLFNVGPFYFTGSKAAPATPKY